MSQEPDHFYYEKRLSVFQYRLPQEESMKIAEKIHREDNQYQKELQEYHLKKVREHQYKFNMAPPVIIYKNPKKEDQFADKRQTYQVFHRNLNRKHLNPEKHTIQIIEPLNQRENLEEVLRKTKKAQIEVNKNQRKKDYQKIFYPDFWTFEQKRNLLIPTDMIKIDKHIEKTNKIKKYKSNKQENNFEIQLKDDDLHEMQISEIYGLKNLVSPSKLNSPTSNVSMPLKTDQNLTDNNNNNNQSQQIIQQQGQTHDFQTPTQYDDITDDYQLINTLTQRTITPHRRTASENLQTVPDLQYQQQLMKKLILPRNNFIKFDEIHSTNRRSNSDPQAGEFLRLNPVEMERIRQKRHLQQLSTPRTADTLFTPRNYLINKQTQIQKAKMRVDAQNILQDCQLIQEDNEELKHKVNEGINQMFFDKSHKQKLALEKMRLERIKNIIKSDIQTKKQDFRVFYELQRKKLRDIKRRQKYVDGLD